MTPVSAIAASTSLLRLRASARFFVGASRDGACTMPASIADWPRLRFCGRAAEIMAGRGAQAIDAVAEIDRGQIARQDLVLGQPAFQPEGDDHLLRLALEAAVGAEEAGLGQLLGDGAAALADAAGLDVGDHGPADGARVDAPVPAEAAVLDGDEGGRGQRVELGDRHRPVLDGAAAGDRPALGTQQQHRRVVERLQRPAQRRGDDQPDEGDEDQAGKAVQAVFPVRRRCGRRRLGRSGGSLGRLAAEWIRQLLDIAPVPPPDGLAFAHPTFFRAGLAPTALHQ